MLMKSIALVMSLMLLLCGSAASEQLGATNSGGGGVNGAASLSVLEPGVYEVGIDVDEGWYKVTRKEGENAFWFAFNPTLDFEYSLVSYSSGFLSDDEEWGLVLLLDGCLFEVSYSAGAMPGYGGIVLEYLAPKEGTASKAGTGVYETESSIDLYKKAARRNAYISSLDAQKDIIYAIGGNEEWLVGNGMESGVYLLLYMGQGWAKATVKSGELSETEYDLASYEWSVAEGTEYDEFAFPLVEGCTLSCETSQADDFDRVWLVKLSEVN